MELTRYFENPFDNYRLKESEFRTGVQFHIVSLQVNNPGGIYDAIIAQSIPLYDELNAIASALGTEYAQQQGSTITALQAKQAFLRMARLREGLISNAFGGTGSGPYQEFFPYGLKELNRASKLQIDVISARLVHASNIYVAQLGPALHAEFTAARQTYLAARAAQMTNIGETSTLRHRARRARKAMAEQLLRNLYTIGLHHTGNPDAVSSYFDLNIFTPKRKKKR